MSLREALLEVLRQAGGSGRTAISGDLEVEAFGELGRLEDSSSDGRNAEVEGQSGSIGTGIGTGIGNFLYSPSNHLDIVLDQQLDGIIDAPATHKEHLAAGLERDNQMSASRDVEQGYGVEHLGLRHIVGDDHLHGRFERYSSTEGSPHGGWNPPSAG